MIPGPIVPLRAVRAAQPLWPWSYSITSPVIPKIVKIVQKRHKKRPLVARPSLVPAQCGNVVSRAFFSIITPKAGGVGWFCCVAFWCKLWLSASNRVWLSSFFHSPAGGIKWQIMDISVRNNSRTSLWWFFYFSALSVIDFHGLLLYSTYMTIVQFLTVERIFEILNFHPGFIIF